MVPLYENSKEGLMISHRVSKHISPHIHHCIEFIYVTKGTLELGIGTDLFHMDKGDFAVVFPDVIHHYQVFSEKTSTAFYVEALLPANSQFTNTLKTMRPKNPVIKSENLPPDVETSIQALYKEQTRNPIIDQAFVQIILARCMPLIQLEEKSKTGNGDLVYQTVLYIADHFREELTLDRIAKEIGVSKYALSRVFSGTFHSNFKQYINDRRLEYACSMLEDTNQSVTDICLEAGFESQRTFNRVFIEKYRMTPREYRRAYRERYMIQKDKKVS